MHIGIAAPPNLCTADEACHEVSPIHGFKLNARSWRIRESALRSFIERQESGEQEPPTIRSSRSVELGAWRKHVPPEKGAA